MFKALGLARIPRLVIAGDKNWCSWETAILGNKGPKFSYSVQLRHKVFSLIARLLQEHS